MTVAEVFQEISAADFFYRNRDIAGFTSPSRSIYSTIRELVENSLDACETGGIPPDIYVRLSHESGPLDGPGVYDLRIEDNGIGVSSQYLERVFLPFERLHPVEAYGGTGIGLAIVKQGAQRMGGGAGVEPKQGAGSRFWVELPAASEAQ